ncbi:MAG: putative toxin-antitoxin system toxin component, PIN family [Pseudomonadota bacterium]
MILDTDVIVAAIRSTKGASAEIVRRVLRREMPIEISVALVLEYEAVATRAEHLQAGGLTRVEAANLIDALAAVADPVEIHFRWRPQLRDADDEMVLEAAINAQDRTIVTFNTRDFAMAADKFNVTLATPRQILEILK